EPQPVMVGPGGSPLGPPTLEMVEVARIDRKEGTVEVVRRVLVYRARDLTETREEIQGGRRIQVPVIIRVVSLEWLPSKEMLHIGAGGEVKVIDATGKQLEGDALWDRLEAARAVADCSAPAGFGPAQRDLVPRDTLIVVRPRTIPVRGGIVMPP